VATASLLPRLRVAGPLSSSRVAIWASCNLRSPPYHTRPLLMATDVGALYCVPEASPPLG
jgi:hypothetical protein